ncbi:type II toxin-antitoxin system PemK/MazF family toxin [Pleurocapsa sp. FMAR1]|uniref:type II toxin-antitoxin system PemK/MazF family toxin n=1 Tax=Pleurocapsa sp. FMAR1 TaxID=3040204 RepID=UPI0029C95321|nr:type II toxin-antitoxin system PemK/MazF family toxin [Pleurocapsa sp. FMAR1]
MALNKGDIVLVQFPFSDLSQTKLRPALVLVVSASIDEITLCFISSQKVKSLSASEFAIAKSDREFAETGLKADSKVRVTRIITLERKLILRKIGELSKNQILKLNQILTTAFKLK